MAKDHAILDFPKHKRLLVSNINTLNGKFWVEIRRCKKQRSLNQNAYMWGVVYPAVRKGLEEAWGESLTDEEVHEWLKGRFNSQPVVNKKTGEVKGRRPVSTTELDTGEFAEYLDKIIRFAGEQLGVDVPPAES
jgi:hypothetical protein